MDLLLIHEGKTCLRPRALTQRRSAVVCNARPFSAYGSLSDDIKDEGCLWTFDWRGHQRDMTVHA